MDPRIETQISPLICPTVCYFYGKNLRRTHFGHVALGVRVENDLILKSTRPPAWNEEEKIHDYIATLPLAPDRNAYLVAGTGCSLVLATEQDDAALEEKALKALSGRPKKPVLVKKGEDFYIYGSLNKKWAKTPLNGLTEAEKTSLRNLPFAEAGSTLPNGDPLLWSLIGIVKKGHTPENNIYYLDRTRNAGQLYAVGHSEKETQAFMDTYVKNPLSPGELSRSVIQGLTDSDRQHIKEILRHSTPEFSTYLTYGISEEDKSEKDPAGVGTDMNFTNEQQQYGEHVFITLPPCPRDLFDQAKAAFAQKDRHDYTILEENCTKSVVDFMKMTRYLPASASYVRPQACALEAARIALDGLIKARENILRAGTLSDWEKIRLLLENDIQRLTMQIKKDRIRHFALKITENKWKKIKILRELLARFSVSDRGSPALLEALVTARHTLKDKTAANLQQCLDLFPCEDLEPPGGIERKRNFLISLEAFVSTNLPQLAGLKKLFPDYNELESALENTFSASQIYFLFEAVYKKLAEESLKPQTAKNAELVQTYKQWHLKAIAVRSNMQLHAIKRAEDREDKADDGEIDISLSAHSFLDQPESDLASPRIETEPNTWYNVAGSPHSRYRYLKKEEQNPGTTPAQLKQTLVAALARPDENTRPSANATIDRLPRMHKDELRLSTHLLPRTGPTTRDVKFGLLEKCVNPGQIIHSRLILPAKTPAWSTLLLIVDRQAREGFKLLGKAKHFNPSITLRTLDLDDNFKSTRPLKPLEIAFIQYCLAMDYSCKLLKGDNRISLSKAQLEALVPAFEPEQVRQIVRGPYQPAASEASENGAGLRQPRV